MGSVTIFKPVLGAALLCGLLSGTAQAANQIYFQSVQGTIKVSSLNWNYNYLVNSTDLKLQPHVKYSVRSNYGISAIHYKIGMAMDSDLRRPVPIQPTGETQHVFKTRPSSAQVTGRNIIPKRSFSLAAINRCQELAADLRRNGRSDAWIFSRDHQTDLYLSLEATVFNDNPHQRQIKIKLLGAYGVRVTCLKDLTQLVKPPQTKPVLTPSQRYNLKKKLPNLN
ncbi:MAG: hypothetical protein MI743_19260 [Sneathiellales bacterium]|nr:hypothetical protein [Sneathiellales bacterium]